MASAKAQQGGQVRCPICSAPVEPAYRPFCSRRCADVDLSGWLRGRYAIPAEDGEERADAVAGDADETEARGIDDGAGDQAAKPQTGERLPRR